MPLSNIKLKRSFFSAETDGVKIETEKLFDIKREAIEEILLKVAANK